MEKSEVENQTDAALLPYLNSADEKEAETAFAALVSEHIVPTIEKTLRQKSYFSHNSNISNPENQDMRELFSEVKLLIIAELRKLKRTRHGKYIHNFQGYVVSVAVNAYRQYLRAKYPLRQQLKNKLRYLLRHHPKFGLWEDENSVWLCGFDDYRDLKPLKTFEIEQIAPKITEKFGANSSDEAKTIEVVSNIFKLAGSPLGFKDLVSLVAEIQKVKDQPEVYLESSPPPRMEAFAAENNTLTVIENREQLEKIWTEVCELPVRHRRALLLNLKDRKGDGVIRLFPLLRIASIRQIAEALEFSPEDFASIWNELPWDDLKIAELLKLTRQQVINLRHSARAQIIRRFTKKE